MKALCRVCSSTDLISGPTCSGFEYDICSRCGGIQHDEHTIPLAEIDFHPGDADAQARFCLELGQRVFRTIPMIRYMEPGRALSVECNGGLFASHWVSRGWKIVCATSSDAAAKRAESFGFEEIFRSPVSELNMTDFSPKKTRKTVFDAVFAETTYAFHLRPLLQLGHALRGLNPRGAFFIHGLDPTSSKVMEDENPYLHPLLKTVPSPRSIIDSAVGRGLTLLDWNTNEPYFDLTFIA